MTGWLALKIGFAVWMFIAAIIVLIANQQLARRQLITPDGVLFAFFVNFSIVWLIRWIT